MLENQENENSSLIDRVNALKTKIETLDKIQEIIESTSNHIHTQGTTQTTTNFIGRRWKEVDSYIERTTRFIHETQVKECGSTLVKGVQKIKNGQEISKVSFTESDSMDSLSYEATQENCTKLEQEYNVILTVLAGACHDIGHCAYGHDGEDALKSFLKSFKVEDDDKNHIQETRKKYFGNSVTEEGKDYESQQLEQNEYVQDHTTEKGFTFDHGEQGAWAIINILESKGLSIEDSTVNELIQAVLMHSRPAFETDSIAAQAISVADSMAFIADDVEQAIEAKRITEEKIGTDFTNFSEKKLKSIQDQLGEGVVEKDSPFEKSQIETFLKMTPAERLEAAQSEAISKSAKLGKITNGKRYDDLIWIASSLKKSYLTYDEKSANKLLKFVHEKAGLEGTFEPIVIPEGIDKDKILEITSAAAQKITAQIELKYSKEFPINFQCYMMNSAIIQNDLIYANNLGNNTSKDKANTKFMMMNFVKGYEKVFEKEGKEVPKLTQAVKFKEFYETFIKTEQFGILKETLSNKGEFNERGVTIVSKEASPQEVFQALGIHLKFDESGNVANEQGVLDCFSAPELMAKLIGGMTNSSANAYSTALKEQLFSKKDDNGKTVPDIEKYMEFADLQKPKVNPQDNPQDKPPKYERLTPQDLLGLGLSVEEIQVGLESQREKNPGTNFAPIGDKKEDAIVVGIENYYNDQQKQFNSLGTEIQDENYQKILVIYNKADQAVEKVERIAKASQIKLEYKAELSEAAVDLSQEGIQTTYSKILAIRQRLSSVMSTFIEKFNGSNSFEEITGLDLTELSIEKLVGNEQLAEMGKSNEEQKIDIFKTTTDEFAENIDIVFDSVEQYISEQKAQGKEIDYKAIKQILEKHKNAINEAINQKAVDKTQITDANEKNVEDGIEQQMQ